jgi:hypothetical protein
MNYMNYISLFNKFISISVSLYENEALNFNNLDKIEVGPPSNI